MPPINRFLRWPVMGIPQFQDGQLSELKVHWALRGSLLLNLVSACCIAPCLHGNMTLKNHGKSMRVCPDWVRAFGPVCPACQRSVLADEPSNGQHFPGGADSMESPRRGSFHGCGVLRPWTLASMLGAMVLGDCRSSPWNNISACSVRSQTMPS